MDFTKEQLSAVLCKHAERENGLQDLLEIMIETYIPGSTHNEVTFLGTGTSISR